LALVHLHGVWHRRAPEPRVPGPLQERTAGRAWASSAGGHANTRALLAREADGWYVAISCVAVPQPPPPTGQETGMEVGGRVLLPPAPGEAVEPPSHSRIAQAQQRLSRRKQQSNCGGRRRAWWPRSPSRCGSNGTTAPTRPPRRWCEPATTRSR